jgi:hypothetical protein
LICRAAPPTTFTPPTPGIDSKRVGHHLLGDVRELAHRPVGALQRDRHDRRSFGSNR